MITWISASHNDEVYDRFLGQMPFDKHILQLQKGYKNLRSAYNDAVQNLVIKTPYIGFIHHDVLAVEPKKFETAIEYYLKKLSHIDPNHGVVGVAGAKAITWDGRNYAPLYLGSVHWEVFGIEWGHVQTQETEAILEVDTLDGQMLIVKTEDFEFFDEKDYNGLNHFYDVDMCLRMLRKGKKNYVIPVHVRHGSEHPSKRPPIENHQLNWCAQEAVRKYPELMPRASTCTMMRIEGTKG